ncbi:MAG: hypothetical protein ACHQJ6_09295, partial [Candidatus Berkiellales bacterium]
MLYWRIITAVILIPLVLWGVFYLPHPWFAIASAGVFGLGWLEWAKFCYLNRFLQILTFIFFMLLMAILY